MDAVSPFPALVACATAVGACSLLVMHTDGPPLRGRYAAIDGLRGYLAFSVFLHHACLWYYFLRSARWQAPPSNTYTGLGEGSLVLFFMITGFLFFGKLLDDSDGIDWGKLYISRILRLAPLYLVVMTLLFVVVAILSNGSLREPPAMVAGEIFRWITFTVLGGRNINGVSDTSIILAQVTWSLPYEWLFYFALPLLALTLRSTPRTRYVLISLFAVNFMLFLHVQFIRLIPFLAGIAAAGIVRAGWLRRFALLRISSILALGCIFTAFSVFPTAYDLAPICLLFAAFSLIASGCDLFGLLVSAASRMLGEIAYSIYLLHGLLLFSVFTFVIGPDRCREMSALAHWLWIIGMTPLLILASYVSYGLIERPAMQSVPAVTADLRRLVQWLRSPQPHLARSTELLPRND